MFLNSIKLIIENTYSHLCQNIYWNHHLRVLHCYKICMCTRSIFTIYYKQS
ncbi:hypothetical protein Hanom_Chr01g00029791 [Helianthus anomalus]